MLSNDNLGDQNESPPPEKRLTVVIPHFNQKDFLPRAVASILHGETGEIEIIIVDDGSTDGSEPVLAALEAVSPLVTVMRGKTNQATSHRYTLSAPPAGFCRSPSTKPLTFITTVSSDVSISSLTCSTPANVQRSLSREPTPTATTLTWSCCGEPPSGPKPYSPTST